MAIRTRGAALQIDVTVTRSKADGTGDEQVRHRETFHGTVEKAKAREATIEAALKNHQEVPALKSMPGAAKITLREALDTTYDRYWSKGGQARTIKSNMAVCIEFFGPTKAISEITNANADDFIAWMQGATIEGVSAPPKDYSPATVRQKVATLTKMFKHFNRRGEIKFIPLFETDPIGDNQRDRVVTQAEEDTLLDLLLTQYDVVTQRRTDGRSAEEAHALIAFLMDTGARPSEVRKLDAQNLRGSLLTIRGVQLNEEGKHRKASKTGKTRTLPLTRRALAAFKRMVELHGDKPFEWATEGTLRHIWDWARDQMGLSGDPGFIPYALRHTCATRLYAKTKNIVLVMQWLGHTDIKMTMRYAKLMPGDLEGARDLLEGPLPAEPVGVLLAA